MPACCQTAVFFDTPRMTLPHSKTLMKSRCTFQEECDSQEAHRCEPRNVAACASADRLLWVNPQFSWWRKDWQGTCHLITHLCYVCACLQVCVCLIQQLLKEVVSSEATWVAALDATWNNKPVCVFVYVFGSANAFPEVIVTLQHLHKAMRSTCCVTGTVNPVMKILSLFTYLQANGKSDTLQHSPKQLDTLGT